MTVKELRQLLGTVENQDSKVTADGYEIASATPQTLLLFTEKGSRKIPAIDLNLTTEELLVHN
jgi:hypothetical protein